MAKYKGIVTKTRIKKQMENGSFFSISNAIIEMNSGKVPVEIKGYFHIGDGESFTADGELNNGKLDLTNKGFYKKNLPNLKDRIKIFPDYDEKELENDESFMIELMRAIQSKKMDTFENRSFVMNYIAQRISPDNAYVFSLVCNPNNFEKLFGETTYGEEELKFLRKAQKFLNDIQYYTKKSMNKKVKSETTDKAYKIDQNQKETEKGFNTENYQFIGNLSTIENKIVEHIFHLMKNGRRNDENKVRKIADKLFKEEHQFSKLDDDQKEAVIMAVCEPISIITGGPGTGKSTVMEAVTRLLELVDKKNIYLTAPTGKAAKRLGIATKKLATTIHRMVMLVKGIMGRDKNAGLKDSTLVIDEGSMLDLKLADESLSYLDINGKVIISGDHNQLPSIGAGRLLADLLLARNNNAPIIPQIELKKIYRTGKGSKIAVGAKKIKRGEIPEFDDDNLIFKKIDRIQISAELKKRVSEKNKKPDDFIDSVVLTAQHKGSVGTLELNKYFSQVMNPSGATIPGILTTETYIAPRVDDRIIITENKKIKYNGEEFDITNGDTGFITGYDKNFIYIKLDTGENFGWPINSWNKIELAYAITVHKSQGSEYKYVYMPISGEQEKMLDRLLIYTGVTRAKETATLMGELDVLTRALKIIKGSDRTTTLKSNIEKKAQEFNINSKVWGKIFDENEIEEEKLFDMKREEEFKKRKNNQNSPQNELVENKNNTPTNSFVSFKSPKNIFDDEDDDVCFAKPVGIKTNNNTPNIMQSKTNSEVIQESDDDESFVVKKIGFPTPLSVKNIFKIK